MGREAPKGANARPEPHLPRLLRRSGAQRAHLAARLATLAHELGECDRRRVSVVVVDLSNLDFLDRAAFKLFLDYGRRLRHEGRHLSLVNPSIQVRRILTVGAMVHSADVLDEWLDPPLAGV